MRPIDIIYANKLKQLREAYCIKQLVMADMLALSQQEYSQLELGRRSISLSVVRKIHHFSCERAIGLNDNLLFWFNEQTFNYLSSESLQHESLELIQLYFKSRSINEQLKMVEQELQIYLKELNFSPEKITGYSIIRIGYLK